MKTKSILMALAIIGAMLLLTCGKDNSTDPNNTAPRINSLTASPDSVQRGESSTITCDAVDPQGGVLTYFWAATGGSISGSGQSATWTAPDTIGVFSITCNVQNAQGTESSRKVNVHVVKPNIPQQGLIAYYPFVNDAKDASDSHHDGTLMGGATASSFLTITRNTTDMMSLPYQILDGLGDFTASAWVRIETLNVPNTLISGARTGVNNAFVFFYFPNDRKWEMYINDNYHVFDQDIVVEDLKWHHVTMVRSGAIARLYVDGNEVGTGITVNSDPLDIDPNRLMIGQYQPSPNVNFSWAGDIDNLCFYDRALSAAEVQQLANNPHSN